MPFCVSQFCKGWGRKVTAGMAEHYFPILMLEGQVLSISIHVMVPATQALESTFCRVSMVLQNHRIKRCHMFNKHLAGTFYAPEVGAQRSFQGDLQRI